MKVGCPRFMRVNGFQNFLYFWFLLTVLYLESNLGGEGITRTLKKPELKDQSFLMKYVRNSKNQVYSIVIGFNVSGV